MATVGSVLSAIGIVAAVLGFGIYFGSLPLSIVRASRRPPAPRQIDRLHLFAIYARLAGMLGLLAFVLGISLQGEISWVFVVVLVFLAVPYVYLLAARPLTPENPLGFDPKRVAGLRGPDRPLKDLAEDHETRPPLDP